MKLQKQLAYKYKDTKYYKHVIIIPEEAIEELGWQAGVELEKETSGNALVIRPVGQKKVEESEVLKPNET